MIKLKNGTTIVDNHEQDCCENVYADWSALEDTTFHDEVVSFEQLELKEEHEGFSINGYFVPCYEQQNGYYSNNLEIVAKSVNGDVKRIDADSKWEDY